MLHIDNMRPWEKVLIVLKRHWIVYVILWIYFSFWLLITFIVLQIPNLYPFSYILLCVFWMFWAVFLFVQWLNHELDMFVITDNRIIWIEQISFLNRNVTECNLWQVQEVNSKTKWLFSNILNYWTIEIQTAWNATNLVMTLVSDSIGESRKILNVVDNYRDLKANNSLWENKK